jgi:hypothetical protein
MDYRTLKRKRDSEGIERRVIVESCPDRDHNRKEHEVDKAD